MVVDFLRAFLNQIIKKILLPGLEPTTAGHGELVDGDWGGKADALVLSAMARTLSTKFVNNFEQPPSSPIFTLETIKLDSTILFL